MIAMNAVIDTSYNLELPLTTLEIGIEHQEHHPNCENMRGFEGYSPTKSAYNELRFTENTLIEALQWLGGNKGVNGQVLLIPLDEQRAFQVSFFGLNIDVFLE